MKKFLYLLLSIILGIIFQGINFFFYGLFSDVVNGVKEDIPIGLFLSGIALMAAALLIILMRYFTRLYDGKSKNDHKEISDWRFAMTTIFIALLVLVEIVCVIVADKFDDNDVGIVILSISLVVTVSFFMYIFNYKRLLPRKEKIKNLIRGDNLYLVNRRVSFLIEDIINGNTVKGRVIGDLSIRDNLWYIKVNNDLFLTGIKKIIKDGVEVKLASDEIVELELAIEPNEIPLEKYDTLANYKPLSTKTKVNNVENPTVRTVIEGYFDCNKDEEFTSTFLYNVCHGQYLIPALLEKKDVTGDIMDPYTKNTTVKFLAVSNDENPDDHILPIFTDWEALGNYEEVINSDCAASFVLDFPSVIRIMRESKYKGIVINPFGPCPFYLNDDYVLYITTLEGYKRDFIYNE